MSGPRGGLDDSELAHNPPRCRSLGLLFVYRCTMYITQRGGLIMAVDLSVLDLPRVQPVAAPAACLQVRRS